MDENQHKTEMRWDETGLRLEQDNMKTSQNEDNMGLGWGETKPRQDNWDQKEIKTRWDKTKVGQDQDETRQDKTKMRQDWDETRLEQDEIWQDTTIVHLWGPHNKPN